MTVWNRRTVATTGDERKSAVIRTLSPRHELCSVNACLQPMCRAVGRHEYA